MTNINITRNCLLIPLILVSPLHEKSHIEFYHTPGKIPKGKAIASAFLIFYTKDKRKPCITEEVPLL